MTGRGTEVARRRHIWLPAGLGNCPHQRPGYPPLHEKPWWSWYVWKSDALNSHDISSVSLLPGHFDGPICVDHFTEPTSSIQEVPGLTGLPAVRNCQACFQRCWKTKWLGWLPKIWPLYLDILEMGLGHPMRNVPIKTCLPKEPSIIWTSLCANVPGGHRSKPAGKHTSSKGAAKKELFLTTILIVTHCFLSSGGSFFSSLLLTK